MLVSSFITQISKPCGLKALRYVTALPQDERETIEIDFWRTSETQKPEADNLLYVIDKFCLAKVLLEKLDRFPHLFERADSILELGGGQGWAACILKRMFPDKRVFASDISPYAVASTPKMEKMLGVKLDGVFACRSYAIPVEDGSMDLAFCFASAHHFGAHRGTLSEIFRVLKVGGAALYLHEPSCRRYIYWLAAWRAKRRKRGVPEDVLVYKEIKKVARDVGFAVECRFHPTTTARGPLETVYYLVLQILPFLKHLLPCTVDYVFTKNQAG